MATCRKCSAPISWLRRKNGTWMRPFEFDERLEIVEYDIASDDDGEMVATPVAVFTGKFRGVEHKCKPVEKLPTVFLDSYTESRLEKKVVELKEKLHDHNRIIAMAEKLSRWCDVCHAQPFVWCQYKNKPDIETLNLHAKR